MICKGHWGVEEVAVQKRTREATMAKRMMIVMVGVVRFMVVWLEILEYVTVAESKILGLSIGIRWLL
jgi:hypothetical protein